MTLEDVQLAVKPIKERKQERLFYLDWLRIFATLLLFFFHTARVFSFENNYVENDIISPTIVIFFIFVIHTFHMPLFFLISGASTYLSLQKRGIKKYSFERVTRLFIPFILGILIVVPPQPFLASLTYQGYAGNYFNWMFFDYFQLGLGDIEGYRGDSMTPSHLWFIGVLFILSFVALPMIVLMERKDSNFIQKIGDFAEKRPFLTLYIIPTVIVTVAIALPIEIAGKNAVYYLACFLFGYIIVHEKNRERFGRLIKSIRLFLVLIMAIGYPIFIIYKYLRVYTEFGSSLMSYFIDGFGLGIVMWATILVLYSVFMEKGNRTGPVHKYSSQAAYPLYIQHQTWLFIVAYFVVQLPIHYGFKYVIILIGGFLLSIIGFEIIRRVNLLRIMFGMKWKKRLPSKTKIVNRSN